MRQSSNLAIGQRYLSYLSRQDGIDKNLIKMLASYNSGPGNFLRWGAEIRDNGDPLLFIEAIPVDGNAGLRLPCAGLFVDLCSPHAPACPKPRRPGGRRIPPLHAAGAGAQNGAADAGAALIPARLSAGDMTHGQPR